MKACWGSGGTSPLILDIDIKGRWVVSFTHRPLCSRFTLARRLVGPQSLSGSSSIYRNNVCVCVCARARTKF